MQTFPAGLRVEQGQDAPYDLSEERKPYIFFNRLKGGKDDIHWFRYWFNKMEVYTLQTKWFDRKKAQGCVCMKCEISLKGIVIYYPTLFPIA